MVPFALPDGARLEVRFAEPRLHEAASSGRPPVARATPAGRAASLLRLELPPDTPPGNYEARVEIGESVLEVIVQVAPQVRVVMVPDHLWLSADNGHEVKETLALANLGNVPVEIAAKAAMGLYDSNGLEQAAYNAFTAPTDKGESLVERLAAELAAGHGGLVMARIEGGKSTIAPGESREVSLSLELKGPLRPGHSYFGSLTLCRETRLPITVEVPGAAPPR